MVYDFDSTIAPISVPAGYRFGDELNAIRLSQRLFLAMLAPRLGGLRRFGAAWESIAQRIQDVLMIPGAPPSDATRPAIDRIAFEAARVETAKVFLVTARVLVDAALENASNAVKDAASPELTARHATEAGDVGTWLRDGAVALQARATALQTLMGLWRTQYRQQIAQRRLEERAEALLDLEFQATVAVFASALERIRVTFNAALFRSDAAAADDLAAAYVWLTQTALAALSTRATTEAQDREVALLVEVGQRGLRLMQSARAEMDDASAVEVPAGGTLLFSATTVGSTQSSSSAVDGWEVGPEQDACHKEGEPGGSFTHNNETYSFKGAEREVFVAEPQNATDREAVMRSTFVELGGPVEFVPLPEMTKDVDRVITETITVDISGGPVARNIPLKSLEAMIEQMRGLVCGARDRAESQQSRFQLELLDEELRRYAAMKGYFEEVLGAGLVDALGSIERARKIAFPPSSAITGHPLGGIDMAVLAHEVLTPAQLELHAAALSAERERIAAALRDTALGAVDAAAGVVPALRPLTGAKEILEAALDVVCADGNAVVEKVAGKAVDHLQDVLRDRLRKKYPGLP